MAAPDEPDDASADPSEAGAAPGAGGAGFGDPERAHEEVLEPGDRLAVVAVVAAVVGAVGGALLELSYTLFRW
ncbi:MAG: hypothetical protein AAGN82_17635 [Myxococcota bacterium]